MSPWSWLNKETVYTIYCFIKEVVVKQKKFVKELYRAFFDHDAEKIAELKKLEFAKIAKRRAEGRPFNTRWVIVQL